MTYVCLFVHTSRRTTEHHTQCTASVTGSSCSCSYSRSSIMSKILKLVWTWKIHLGWSTTWVDVAKEISINISAIGGRPALVALYFRSRMLLNTQATHCDCNASWFRSMSLIISSYWRRYLFTARPARSLILFHITVEPITEGTLLLICNHYTSITSYVSFSAILVLSRTINACNILIVIADELNLIILWFSVFNLSVTFHWP